MSHCATPTQPRTKGNVAEAFIPASDWSRSTSKIRERQRHNRCLGRTGQQRLASQLAEGTLPVQLHNAERKTTQRDSVQQEFVLHSHLVQKLLNVLSVTQKENRKLSNLVGLMVDLNLSTPRRWGPTSSQSNTSHIGGRILNRFQIFVSPQCVRIRARFHNSVSKHLFTSPTVCVSSKLANKWFPSGNWALMASNAFFLPQGENRKNQSRNQNANQDRPDPRYGGPLPLRGTGALAHQHQKRANPTERRRRRARLRTPTGKPISTAKLAQSASSTRWARCGLSPSPEGE